MLKGREIKGLWVLVPKNKGSYLSQNNGIKNEEENHLENQPLVGIADGLVCLGRIEDMVFNCFGVIEGFLVATSGIWKSVRFLPVTEITAMDEGFFCIKDKASLVKIKKEMLFRGCKNWIGAKVFTADGEDFGTVTDVILSPTCSSLVGLEISQGFMSDLESGRKFLPWGEIITVEDKAVLTNKEERQQL